MDLCSYNGTDTFALQDRKYNLINRQRNAEPQYFLDNSPLSISRDCSARYRKKASTCRENITQALLSSFKI